MKKRSRAGAGAITAICLSLGFGFFGFSHLGFGYFGLGSEAHTRIHSPVSSAIQKGAAMAAHATGTFDVKLTPQPPDDKAEGSTLGRMTIDKQFHGDLEGTAKGQMLTAGTDVKGSAGYVAIERITGMLHGRTGSFVLQHSGILARGAQQQSVTVVPDSGTGQLAGISGKMTGTVDSGKHSYDLEYTLPEASDK
jgi:hypothetical protein